MASDYRRHLHRAKDENIHHYSDADMRLAYILVQASGQGMGEQQGDRQDRKGKGRQNDLRTDLRRMHRLYNRVPEQ